MQWSTAIGRVERRTATVRLHVDRIAWANKSRHVGDRVGHHEAATGGPADVQRLIKIPRAGRVDRDQLQIGAIKIGKARLYGGSFSGSLDLRRKPVRHLRRGADGSQALGQLLRYDGR